MPSPEEQRRLEDLLDTAGRTAQPTAFGWETLAGRLAATPQQQPQGLGRWATLPLGLAAAATLLLALWLGLGRHREAEAAPAPIKVQRLAVDLTVLSVAETEGQTLYMPLIGQTPRSPATREAGRPGRVHTRLMRGLVTARGRELTGQALVRDRRLVLNLRKGDNVVRFTDVAASIDPTSVRFESLTDPKGTHVVEQSFEYDLATADALLSRYLDREVTCVGKDGQERTGQLASFDAEATVLASEPPDGEKQRRTESLSRRALRAVKLGELPSGLITRPTLVWTLRTQTPGKHETVLTYICGLMQWQADYVVHVTPARGKEPDRLDVSGWVTIENTSGATFPEAGLRLIAGDVNRLRDPWATTRPPESEVIGSDFDGEPPIHFPQLPGLLVEKAFFEYHLYTLPHPTTLRDRQIKQLRLLERKGIKATRRYVYDPTEGTRHLAIALLAKNEKENRLGLPLPKGRVALEQRGADRETALIGRTAIDHTPVKEELTLWYGRAFDVVGEHRQMSLEYLQVPRIDRYRTTYEIRVRNHKAEPVEVRAFARRLGRGDTLPPATMPHHRKDTATAYFDFRLGPNAEQVIRYTIETQE
jgi:hypothetical protein